MTLYYKYRDKGRFEDNWLNMEPIIKKFLHQEPVTRKEWQDLFFSTYTVCLGDDNGTLKIKENLEKAINEYTQNVQNKVMVHYEEQALLKSYIAEWRKFFAPCRDLPGPFVHFECFVNGRISKKPGHKNNVRNITVRKIMLDIWKLNVFDNIKQRLQDAAMNMIYLERNGEKIDSQLIIEVKQSFIDLCSDNDDPFQIYKNDYEQAYINSTKLFYKTRAFEYFEDHGVLKYMKYADDKICEEEIRSVRYLETSSAEMLTECCTRLLFSNFYSAISVECKDIIESNNIEMISYLFKFINRVRDGIIVLIDIFEDLIVTEGLAINKASSEIIIQKSEKYVEQLLLLYNKFNRIVHDAFFDDPRFLTSRDKAFKCIVNDTTVFQLELSSKQNTAKYQSESKCPLLLASFCDVLLRKTTLSKNLTTEEIVRKLKDVLLVLKYVENKDVFMGFYVAHLTRRLLLNTSTNFDKEETMVYEFREVGMPPNFINKLAIMFQDIKVSEDLNQQFKDIYKTTKGNIADSINIKMLNAGIWSRSSEHVTVSLPMELEDCIPLIEDFYKKKHSGRTLRWYHHMSNATIIFSNDMGSFEIKVTTFQMAILFIWNERPKDKISFEHLRLASGLPDPELRRTLWSLISYPKLKKQILMASCDIQTPNEFNDNIQFWINDEFCIIKNDEPQKRGKLNIIGRLQLSTQHSNTEDNTIIVELRILRVQEAIIKIMKMRKQISHFNLHLEVILILKNMFLPSKKMVQEQVEWLIEKKYIKEDTEDKNTLIYVA